MQFPFTEFQVEHECFPLLVEIAYTKNMLTKLQRIFAVRFESRVDDFNVISTSKNLN